MNDMSGFFPSPPQSEAPGTQQLSFGFWLDDAASAQMRALMSIAQLEREADEARCDWLESRARPEAPALWSIFARKATVLDMALAARRRPDSASL